MEKKYSLNSEYYIDLIVSRIKEFYSDKPKAAKAVIGISGGKDSTVCAALLVKALGAERVIPVLMPNGEQKDIEDSRKVCEILGLKHVVEINIGDTYKTFTRELAANVGTDIESNKLHTTNTPARIRMMTLYAVAAHVNGFVCNTCNLSEDYIGYSTKYGDAVGDFSLINKFTVSEVSAIGMELELPRELIYKAPSDGMCGKTDEDNLGFTYKELDEWIRYGIKGPSYDKIEKMHNNKNTELKLVPMLDAVGSSLPDAKSIDKWRS